MVALHALETSPVLFERTCHVRTAHNIGVNMDMDMESDLVVNTDEGIMHEACRSPDTVAEAVVCVCRWWFVSAGRGVRTGWDADGARHEQPYLQMVRSHHSITYCL